MREGTTAPPPKAALDGPVLAGMATGIVATYVRNDDIQPGDAQGLLASVNAALGDQP